MSIQGIEQNVQWRGSLEEAREDVRSEGKLVFVFLWHHNCGGSKTMGEITYPDGAVRAYIEEHFVPVRFNTIERPEVEESFNSGWTPTIIVDDAEGREHRRSQGYLDPRRFIGEMALARKKALWTATITRPRSDSRRRRWNGPKATRRASRRPSTGPPSPPSRRAATATT